MNVFEGKDSINNPEMIFPGIDEMRIPVDYLASILTAGNIEPVKTALYKLAMMRLFMRAESSGKAFDTEKLSRVGLDAATARQLYRLLAIAKYEDRFVIPKQAREQVTVQVGDGIDMETIDLNKAQGAIGYDQCNGCSLSDLHSSMIQKAQNGKKGNDIYAETFYGGMWRD
jgi:nitrate reductase beta subunit